MVFLCFPMVFLHFPLWAGGHFPFAGRHRWGPPDFPENAGGQFTFEFLVQQWPLEHIFVKMETWPRQAVFFMIFWTPILQVFYNTFGTEAI